MESRRDRFEQIAPTLVEPLRRFLARRTDPATAEDVLAETLLVCWRRVEDLPDQPLPWAYGVARLCLANAERSARRQQRLAARIAAEDPPRATMAGPEPATEADPALDQALDHAMARLRPGEAELLRLWAWEQLEPAEIAAVMGITPNAASIRLHRARQRLRAELETGRSGAGGKTGRRSGHEESREGRRP